MSAFCSWVLPIAILFAGLGAVVLALGIYAEDILVGLGWLGGVA